MKIYRREMDKNQPSYFTALFEEREEYPKLFSIDSHKAEDAQEKLSDGHMSLQR